MLTPFKEWWRCFKEWLRKIVEWLRNLLKPKPEEKPPMPRTEVAVCSRPSYEAATKVGSMALKHVVDAWTSRGYAVTDLFGAAATKANVLASLTSQDPILFFGVGHGNADTWTCHDSERMFWTCDSSALRGRIVYALSCITAQRLGPDAVAGKGCRTYIGYADTFGWVQMNIEADPLTDALAKGFYEPVLGLLNRLIDGGSTGDAFKASMDIWNAWIDFWSKSTDPNAAAVLQWLIHDRDCQKLIGDELATVATVVPDLWWLLQSLGASIPMVIPAIVIGGAEVDKLHLWG